MSNIAMPTLRCRHCEYLGKITGDHRPYIWVPRPRPGGVDTRPPQTCPRCHRKDWDAFRYGERTGYAIKQGTHLTTETHPSVTVTHGELGEVILDRLKTQTQRMIDGDWGDE